MAANQYITSAVLRDRIHATKTSFKEAIMTDNEKLLLTAMKEIKKEARKNKPDPDKIYQLAEDAVNTVSPK